MTLNDRSPAASPTVPLHLAHPSATCRIPPQAPRAIPPKGRVAVAGCTLISARRSGGSHVELAFNNATAWYFTPGVNTVTQIISDGPGPSTPGQTSAVQVAVVEAAGIVITGEPRGSIEVSDGVGGSCTITLAGTVGEVGSCNLNTAASGTQTLTARYLGFGGWDSSAGTAMHTVGAGGVIFLNGFE